MGITHASSNDQVESPIVKKWLQDYGQVGKVENYSFKRSLGEFMESPIVKRMWQSYGQVGKVENYDFSRGKRSVDDQLESPIVKRMTQSYGQVGKVENYDYSRGKRMTQFYNGPIGQLTQAAAVPNIVNYENSNTGTEWTKFNGMENFDPQQKFTPQKFNPQKSSPTQGVPNSPNAPQQDLIQKCRAMCSTQRIQQETYRVGRITQYFAHAPQRVNYVLPQQPSNQQTCINMCLSGKLVSFPANVVQETYIIG
jgi:hypothetical protein